jgi:hypothetical protein
VSGIDLGYKQVIGLRRPSLDKGLEEAGLTSYAITAFIQQSV